MRSKISKSLDGRTQTHTAPMNTSIPNSNPYVYPTPADPTIPIPEGRIIDDSARGTLFWEVVESKHRKSKRPSAPSSMLQGSSSREGSSTSSKSKSHTDTQLKPDTRDNSSSSEDESVSNNWTVPFQIEWLSAPGKTVPFFMVKHLNNPYNNNQPVKIARDGTEIEPSVGRQIIELFNS